MRDWVTSWYPVALAPLLAASVLAACGQEGSSTAADQAGHDSASTVTEGDVLSRGEVAQDPWASAERTIRHLPMAAFRELPDWAAIVFEAHGCMVPQAFHSAAPHNLIRGELAGPGQVDWVALCSRGDTAEIVVAWGGPLRCPSVLAPSAKRNQLQQVGGDSRGYSRALGIVSIDVIKRLSAEFGGPPPPSEDHQGLEDAFVDKASTVFYCHDGRWHASAGVD